MQLSRLCPSIYLLLFFITRCAYAQGRVKRLSPSICLFVVKNTAVCCLTARKSPRNSSLPLGLANILRKMPRKPWRAIFFRTLYTAYTIKPANPLACFDNSCMHACLGSPHSVLNCPTSLRDVVVCPAPIKNYDHCLKAQGERPTSDQILKVTTGNDITSQYYVRSMFALLICLQF